MKTIFFMAIMIGCLSFSNKLLAQQHEHDMNMKMDTVKKKVPQKKVKKKTAVIKTTPVTHNMEMPRPGKHAASDTTKAGMEMNMPARSAGGNKNMNVADTSMKGMGDHEMKM